MALQRDVEVADTLPPDDAMRAASTPTALPLADWDRYEMLELLGKGGMGSVYKARDRRLDRTIAIKLILGIDPNLTMRFLREARAQARIDHPHVCRVYEAGETDGRAYIALQLIDGEPLHKAAARMSLDEKVAVMRDVAVAIQEAHRLGIVHRDLKPANIMVERTADGRWFPVVMDFGLAREATVELGITESGVPLGTPAYMSPEQARGDVHAIDRRSDVYSLGATLYELLTGSLPFTATSLAQALALIIDEDPPAPRTLVPSLPVDLETIALKCLAKDPGARYSSARRLADDLERYLQGEPILGRRLSVWQRVRLRARRQRALVILGAWSLAIIVAIAALGVRAWLTSRSERALTAERTRLAERLGRDAKDIELSLQSAYQRPLHDTRDDRKRMRERMDIIAATSHNLGSVGDAVVHDALGLGHLALHEWRDAADELGRAETAGLPAPDLHVARGRALGELYHRALEDARISGGPEWLAGRQRELDQQYLTPALTELEQSRAAGEGADLLEALVALYRRDFAGAEQRARSVAERAPWLIEAHKLAADAAYGAALEAFDRAEYDPARLGLERAASLYAEASDIVRSDASVYEAAAQTWLQRAELNIRQHRDLGEPLGRALDTIERALQADPDDAAAYTIKAYVLLRWYRTPSLRAEGKPLPLLDRMTQTAARAVEIDPRNARAWNALGNAHLYRGHDEDSPDAERAPWFNRARDEFGKALELQPNDPRAHSALGTALRWLGTELDDSGHDPMPMYLAALGSYERATTLDPQYKNAWSNQADLYTAIAEHDYAVGIDPRPAVDNALRAGERSLELDPAFYAPLHTMAQAELALVHYLVETGGDPSTALTSARGYLDRAEKTGPELQSTWFYRLVAAGAEAAFHERQGSDPTSAVATGRAALRRADPHFAYSYIEAARLELVAAAWAAHTGRDPAGLLAGARADAEKAVALDGKLADPKLAVAEVCLEIAKAQPSRAVVDRGVTYVEQALARNPQLLKAQTVRAALVRLRAP